MKCRHRAAPLRDVFLDLGSAPPSNAFLSEQDLLAPEAHFPLRLYTCQQCHLVQVDEVQRHDALFSGDYVYFSSYSRTWLTHAERYVDQAVQRLQLNSSSLVLEIASNDGYLLQYVQARGIPCVGVEPTASTAQAARARGVETLEQFFGQRFAQDFSAHRRQADLVIGNNVLAHVPDVNDFVAGLATVLTPEGVVTLEFPHLLQLVQQRQFDTVYHEHFSYFSLHTVTQVLARCGLRIWDVEELPTHGGSLRLWACHSNAHHVSTPAVVALQAKEAAAGMLEMAWYQVFNTKRTRSRTSSWPFCSMPNAKAGRWWVMAPPPKAIPCSTMLAYARICCPMWWTPRRTSRGGICQVHAFRSLLKIAFAPRAPTTLSSSHGTCATKSWTSWLMCGDGAGDS